MTEDDRTEDDRTGDGTEDDRTGGGRTGEIPGHEAGEPRDGTIDALLRSARGATAPIGANLRARILADAPVPSPTSHPGFSFGRWLGGLVAMPGAALPGL